MVKLLPWEHDPVVKARGIVDTPMSQMPFADHSRLVALLPQQLGKRELTAIHLGGQRGDVVDMVVGTRQNRRPTGCTDRIGAEAIVELHPFMGDPIKVRCLIDAASVTTHRVGCMVIRHNVQDIRSSVLQGKLLIWQSRSGISVCLLHACTL